MMMMMMKTTRINKYIFLYFFNKKSVIIPDKKGTVGYGFVKRYHMIGYSIESDKRSCTGDIKLNLY